MIILFQFGCWIAVDVCFRKGLWYWNWILTSSSHINWIPDSSQEVNIYLPPESYQTPYDHPTIVIIDVFPHNEPEEERKKLLFIPDDE